MKGRVSKREGGKEKERKKEGQRERGRKMERETDRQTSVCQSTFQIAAMSGAGPGFPRHISREMDGKWSSQDSDWHHYGMPALIGRRLI